jgi:hypothetical protein
LTELSFTLNSALAADLLESATFTSAGYETLLFGVSTVTTGSTSAVPLPGALPLFATGLAGLCLLGWRRKKKTIAA